LNRPTLPFLTNLDLDQFPLEAVLPRLARAHTALQAKRAVTGQTATRRWDQTSNYLTSLGHLGLWSKTSGLTELGRELAGLAKSPQTMKRRLAQHVMGATTLGLVVRALYYTAPTYAGDALVRESMRTLEVAFNVDVQGRKQLFYYTFSFLRHIGLLDAHNVPVKSQVNAALNLDADRYLNTLASLDREEAVLMEALIRVFDEGPVTAQQLKERIRRETGEVLETGLGGKGLGKRLKNKGLISVVGGKGKGARDTRLRVASETVKDFLVSPLARAHLIRANFEAGGLLAHLGAIVRDPLKKVISELRRNQRSKGSQLEIVAAKIAFKLGCTDITLRSRLAVPAAIAEGEKDVLATLPRPVPYRMLVQCKAHRSPLGTSVLYRELAIALLSTNVKTILFFSTGGFQESTLLMQRACLRAFPFLTVALFDDHDLDRLASGEPPTRVVFERLRQVTEQQRVLEEALSPRQLRSVKSAMVEAGIPNGKAAGVIDLLWRPDWVVSHAGVTD
jgi:hypothetical protein